MKTDAKVAYFSPEFGIEKLIFSGGLGILAGDFLKSCADRGLPIVGVGLLYNNSNYHQRLLDDGWQEDWYTPYDPSEIMQGCEDVDITVPIEDRDVLAKVWEYRVKSSIPGAKNYLPLLLLSTNGCNGERDYDDNICAFLYPGQGDKYHRLAQQQVLGKGGVRMLEKLGFNNVQIYHMNEGYTALLGLELLQGYGSLDEAKKHIVFTTHTPVPAGNDYFHKEIVERVIGREFLPWDEITKLTKITESDELNMMRLAMAFSSKAFGVSKLHELVSKYMFKDYPNMGNLSSEDNGIHLPTWVSKEVLELYDRATDGKWRYNPVLLENLLQLSEQEILDAHQPGRIRLGTFLQTNLGSRVKGSTQYDPEKLTIGFARRFVTYKRATLIFDEIDRLRKMGKRIQLIFAGKAHSSDNPGKELIKEVFTKMRELEGKVPVWFIEDYDTEIAKLLVQGVDLWLNNPERLQEGSGTSGMKCAANGIPQLSIQDGWWCFQEPISPYTLPRGYVGDLTGWAIGREPNKEDFKLLNNDSKWANKQREAIRKEDANDLMTKLEHIVDLFKNDKKTWARVMKGAMAHNAPWFNSDRMALDYFKNVYGIPLTELNS